MGEASTPSPKPLGNHQLGGGLPRGLHKTPSHAATRQSLTATRAAHLAKPRGDTLGWDLGGPSIP